MDYDAMGVPITFLDRYNPEQFEILGKSLDLVNMAHKSASQLFSHEPCF